MDPTLSPLGDATRIALSDRLRQARRLSGVSQLHLAQRLDVQRAAVSQWECSGRAVPTMLNLLRVAVELRVAFEWLATGRGPMRLEVEDEIPASTPGSFARSDEEEQLLAAYRGASHKQREALLVMARALARPNSAGG